MYVHEREAIWLSCTAAITYLGFCPFFPLSQKLWFSLAKALKGCELHKGEEQRPPTSQYCIYTLVRLSAGCLAQLTNTRA